MLYQLSYTGNQIQTRKCELHILLPWLWHKTPSFRYASTKYPSTVSFCLECGESVLFSLWDAKSLIPILFLSRLIFDKIDGGEGETKFNNRAVVLSCSFSADAVRAFSGGIGLYTVVKDALAKGTSMFFCGSKLCFRRTQKQDEQIYKIAITSPPSFFNSRVTIGRSLFPSSIGFWIQSIGLNTFLKAGRHIDITEAETMRFVAKNTSIPVPKVQHVVFRVLGIHESDVHTLCAGWLSRKYWRHGR